MKTKIVSIVGARPQFIKLAPLSKQLKTKYNEIIIHTGQHYDRAMSASFFDKLNIPKPNYNLNIGSGTHGEQTGKMLAALEKILLRLKPKLAIVFGDTNSTLAGALAAAKIHIPVAHVEAGMRSFNKKMPEERNRILTDHLSDLLFCSTKQSVEWLKNEGLTNNIFQVGDLMIDALMEHAKTAEQKSSILHKLNIKPQSYFLATVHRAENTDYKPKLKGIVIGMIQSKQKIIFPLHPRTKKQLKKFKLFNTLYRSNVSIMPPVDYYDMLQLQKNATKIITDSGGVQKEAYFFKVPCITLREETEWVETLKGGWNKIVGTDARSIKANLMRLQAPKKQSFSYGKGNSSKIILNKIDNFLKK